MDSFAWLDEIATRFERSWRSGNRREIEDFLLELPPEKRDEAVIELAIIEYELRLEMGDSVETREYRDRFPAAAAEIIRAVESRFPTLERPRTGDHPPFEPRIDSADRLSEPPIDFDDDDRYRIVTELGRGGMGRVYLARDEHLGRHLALKRMTERTARSAEKALEHRRRFLREARICAHLEHPGIVPIHDLVDDDRRAPFFTMRRVEGQTLAERLASRIVPASERGPLLQVFAKICQAVAYAHARGVIHRDLKPANIMLGSFGEVQVMDWGLAKTLDAPEARGIESIPVPLMNLASSDEFITHDGIVLGTLAYMPPEQAQGRIEELDRRCDVFSLGAILYEILVGHPPIASGTTTEMLARARIGPWPEAELALSAARDLDPILVDLAKRCLQHDPDMRPSDAAEVARGIDHYLETIRERAHAAEIARVEAEARAAGERKRRLLTVGWITSAAVLTATTAIAWGWIARERRDRLDQLDRAVTSARLDEIRASEAAHDASLWKAAADSADHALDLARALGGAPVGEELLAMRDRSRGEAAAVVADRRLLDELVTARTSLELRGLEGLDSDYAAAMLNYGIDIDQLDVRKAAARLSSRPADFRLQLAAMLDDWYFTLRKLDDRGKRPGRVIDLARALDPDPERDRFRTLASSLSPRSHREEWKSLAETDSIGGLEPPSASIFSRMLDLVGEHALARKVYEKSLARRPHDLWTNFELGKSYRNHQPRILSEAIRRLSIARAVRPDTAHELAHLLESAARFDEAEEIFRELVELRPDSSRHLACLVSRLALNKRPEDLKKYAPMALEACRREIERNSIDAVPHFRLGLILEAQGRLEDAIESYREAAIREPNRAEIQVNLASVLSRAGRREDARRSVDRALQVDARSPAGVAALARLRMRSGDLEGAATEYERLQRLDPENSSLLAEALPVLFQLERVEQGGRLARRILEINPRHAQARLYLAVQLAAAHQPEAAIQEARRALADGNRSAVVLYNLGRKLQRQRRYMDSIEIYRAAISVDPKIAEIHCNLGQALASARDYPAALAALEKGHRLGSSRPKGKWLYPSAQWIEETRAAEKLDGELPEFISGRRLPTSTHECVVLAQIAGARRLHASATALWKSAMDRAAEGPPALESDSILAAAADAAAAAAGRGFYEQPPSGSEIDAWRRFAFEWLDREVRRFETSASIADTDERERIRRALANLLDDPDLRSIRETREIARLRDAEAREFQQLWNRVSLLHSRLVSDESE
ncbi:MAG: protein kinase [Isosphaeraceae bacterium]|nr:protein kinase [Isosphaeraceae bacterium]